MSTNTADSWQFPPHVLREYALLADGERGALVGPRGDIVWLCAPRWDSDAIFSSLIGGHGIYAISPTERFVWGGYYEEGSLIWRSRWVTETGIIECREALTFPAQTGQLSLLRRVVAVDGDATVRVVLDPRSGFGTHRATKLARDDDGQWTGRVGSLRMRWTGADTAAPNPDGPGLALDLTVRAGEHHDFVFELSEAPLGSPLDPRQAWLGTEQAWKDAVPHLEDTVAPRDARHSYAVLRGLTTAGGGMVAAATTSLPERAEQARSYDYRYVWIRDQSYTGQAIAAAGAHPLLDDAVNFVSARLLEDGPNLKPAYTTTGGPVPDQRQLHLPGYPGGQDLVGNWVNKQFQLDSFGEALLLLAAAARHDHLNSDGRRAAQAAVDAIAARWTEPDAGIWEIDDRAWTHSRLICAAGLRAAAETCASPPQAAEWSRLGDAIIADTATTSLHASGRWRRSPQDESLDAALLLPPIRGALSAHDPRTTATLRAYREELTEDYYAYRFRHDQRPLNQAEGAFLLCGFIMCLAEHQQDEQVEAFRWFERTRAACGPPGLYSEEFDLVQRQMRGNLPQAFVHALLLECSARLSRPQAHHD
ncbi:MAG: glycoside hydrolase family 15 protein [Allobranchiibius sp.]